MDTSMCAPCPVCLDAQRGHDRTERIGPGENIRRLQKIAGTIGARIQMHKPEAAETTCAKAPCFVWTRLAVSGNRAVNKVRLNGTNVS